MADFVAVIRRTVDGLSDNVPEMRAKVYDKARGAVRRQLENMKPRPSDDMIERQMAKLEAAISTVEGDHAEALPALDEEQVVASEAPADEPVPVEQEQVVAEEQREPVAEEPEPVDAPVEQVEVQDAPEQVEPAPVVAAEADDAPAVEEPPRSEPAFDHVEEEQPAEPIIAEETREDHAEPAVDEPVVAPEPEHADEVSSQSASYDHLQDDASVTEPVSEQHAVDYQSEPVSEDVTASDDLWQRMPAADEPTTAEPVEPEAAPMPSAASEWQLPEWNDEPVAATAHSEKVWEEAADTVTISDEVPNLADYEPVETVTPLHGDAPAVDQPLVDADHSKDPSQNWDWDGSDPFAQAPKLETADTLEPTNSDWSWPTEKVAAVDEQDVHARTVDDDYDPLLDHGSTAAVGAAAGAAAQAKSAADADVDSAPSLAPRPVSYKIEPKRSRINVKLIAIAAVLLLIVAGGGYAYWANQPAVNSWVASTISSVTAQAPEQGEAETPSTPAADEGDAAPSSGGNTQAPAAEQGNTDVAALGGDGEKFTQRLQADGSEIDDGPAPVAGGEASAQEGKSVAAQTEAGQPQQSAQATPPAAQEPSVAQPPAGQPSAEQPAQADTAATQEIPAGAQKMFLYEERLGQSSPTAIEGNVVWSLKEESPGDNAPPEPVIQAQINVPQRGLTALMTIKRNADSSLPASHVIEFVFSLPDNFEGGSIDNVQRVAMKRNEQDRGDPLIAVPAKITDDFYMIALNDFPEAVTTNTDLLRTRPWIDVPLSYRNGRRALLTLEKGTSGTDAFTKAMQVWSVAAQPNREAQ